MILHISSHGRRGTWPRRAILVEFSSVGTPGQVLALMFERDYKILLLFLFLTSNPKITCIIYLNNLINRKTRRISFSRWTCRCLSKQSSFDFARDQCFSLQTCNDAFGCIWMVLFESIRVYSQEPKQWFLGLIADSSGAQRSCTLENRGTSGWKVKGVKVSEFQGHKLAPLCQGTSQKVSES